jgi:hypothetical protein
MRRKKQKAEDGEEAKKRKKSGDIERVCVLQMLRKFTDRHWAVLLTGRDTGLRLIHQLAGKAGQMPQN